MNARPPTANEPEALREGIDALRALDPDYDVASGAARFEATLTATPTTGAGASRTLRIVTVVAAIVGGAAAIVAWPSRDPSPVAHAGVDVGTTLAPIAEADPPHEAAKLATELRVPDTAGVETREVSPTADPPVEPETPPTKLRDAPRSRTRTRSDPPQAPTTVDADGDDALTREMALLNAARKHVGAGAARTALSSIATARASLAVLHFDEEWDALEILALAGAGRLDDARRLARPFLDEHAAGRFNDSIERAIEPSTENPGAQ